MNNRPIIITGPPGAGKTALISALRARGFAGVDEPARRVLAEQRSFDGPGVPDEDPGLFTALMLSRSVDDYRRRQSDPGPCFFDRGVPDIVAYARLFGVDEGAALRAGEVYRYCSPVYFAPPWRDIYRQDDERRMTFDEARRFGDIMRQVYRQLGYDTVDLPRASTDDRAEFLAGSVRPYAGR